ncbi:cytidyltransferase [Shouchella clausii]|uniref:adenylyltransferase/cytidyltransferase family protein n=1 Tax=Shouchella clausii TaxID=79880 RepID=UPI001B1158C9|nr:adenylyltransferase/cytidyltransferase family protein [Shouchella clausii]GIN09771.1 cytidyltransferase [Shouchella clausii]
MKKYKIGYTTGVFDLFHIGHLNILKQAKEKCEFLIVGVTTDEQVRLLKKKDVVIPFEERIEIVNSIKYVDKAVPETNAQNKFEAWEQYKYNVIFKGDDWKGTDKWKTYEEQFSQKNVDVVYFPYTAGTSSTKLTEAINNLILTEN